MWMMKFAQEEEIKQTDSDESFKYRQQQFHQIKAGIRESNLCTDSQQKFQIPTRAPYFLS